ncbi:MAG: phage holin family protein, partial [Polymorphobacter sp.]
LLLGSLLVLASLFTLLAAVIGWLTPNMGAGNAALVVTLGTAAIGFACMAMGYRRLTDQTKIVVPQSEEAKP